MPLRKLTDENWTDINAAMHTNTHLIEFNASGQKPSIFALRGLGIALSERYQTGNHALSYLCIGDSQMSPAGLAAFMEPILERSADMLSKSGNSGYIVKCLDLENKNMDDLIFDMFAKFSWFPFEKVILARNPISCVPSGLFIGLKELDISKCNLLTNEGIAGIVELLGRPESTLESLIMWDSSVSSAGLESLSTVISRTGKLTRFYYSPEESSPLDMQTKCLGKHFFKVFMKSYKSSLRDLRFKKCHLSYDEAFALGGFLGNSNTLEHLEISDSKLTFDVLQNAFTASSSYSTVYKSNLKRLDLSRNEIDGRLFDLLMQQKLIFDNLIDLNLFGNKINDITASMASVTILELSCNPISINSLKELSGFTGLKQLGLGGILDNLEQDDEKQNFKDEIKKLTQDMNHVEITFEI